MRKVAAALLLIFLASCKKDIKHCYQCDTGQNFSGNYKDVGCYSDNDWNNFKLTDDFGNNLDKGQRCKEK